MVMFSLVMTASIVAQGTPGPKVGGARAQEV